MRRIVVFLACLVIGGSLALAQSPDEVREDSFDSWMSAYSLYKDTTKVSAFLKWVANNRAIRENDSSVMPTAAFLSIVFRDNPAKVAKWAKSTPFSGNAKKVIQRALWLAGQPKLIKSTFGKSPRYAKRAAPNLKKMKLKEPGDLDMMWGAFMASGDVSYPNKIIDVLDEDKALSGDAKMDAATRGAAAWSLGSFYRSHELVNRLIHQRAKDAKGTIKKALDEIISQHEPGDAPLPNRDGQFCAMMTLMAEKDLEEFDKPSDVPIRINSVSKAKRGDIIAITFVFSGMELTDDLRAHVVYDLKIVGPDGELYEDTDLKSQEATRRKLITRFKFYHNDSMVMIRFEPKDKLGEYKFTAELRDLIGKKKTSFHAELELAE
jgi:hypothetical protein